MKKFLFLLLLGSFISFIPILGCKGGEECDHFKCGYRRYPQAHSTLEIKTQSGNILHTHQEIFFSLGDLGENLRTILQSAPDPAFSNTLEDNSLNFASFGFVFFDELGNKINENPYFFGTVESVSEAPIEKPFFFFSGRKKRECRLGDLLDMQGAISGWDALSEDAPSTKDGKEYQGVVEIEKSTKSSNSYLEQRFGIKMTIPLKQIKEALIQKIDQDPFFDHLYKRWNSIKEEQQAQGVCERFSCTLELSVIDIDKKHHIPKETEHEKEGAEKNFTHSEQYALYKMAQNDNLKKFIERCKKRIGGKKIKSYALLIYTRNVMCIRCAQSIVFDFKQASEPRSLCDVINEVLGGPKPGVFIASCERPYLSTIHSGQSDAFETHLKEKKQTKKKENIILDYVQENPQHDAVIYHVLPPLKTGVSQQIMQKLKKMASAEQEKQKRSIFRMLTSKYYEQQGRYQLAKKIVSICKKDLSIPDNIALRQAVEFFVKDNDVKLSKRDRIKRLMQHYGVMVLS
ncbi:MAG: hypothetical protein B7Y25_02700 [Alphaproteobacteria bacterium 16-39-46]|nr:MAG: hypothetical protein B7Y25_02700 [Alphaproteobacteria bacterium 16-39-46]OZA43549.1 MAG: hypothetical protein B7X84_02870 [Alphaproteobacteria bacterium 17-39-52]HQS83806.1 hypothetical protein [Alphaproteobacteria bacterium]HQS93589.1 hypothetical protein [Alphaproteobacteria bacterium]